MLIIRNYCCMILLYPVIARGHNFLNYFCCVLLPGEYFNIWTILKETKVGLLHLCIILLLLIRDFPLFHVLGVV